MASFQRDMLPPARTVYERYGYKLGRRNSKGWVMVQGQPPCHHSTSGRSLSVNVDHGGWHCHGCSAHGDLVSFVMLRDGCDFKTAARTLGAWRDEKESEQEKRNRERDARERDRKREAAEAERESARREQIRLRGQVHDASRIWKEACNRLTELKRGAPPTSADEEEACWAAMSLALKDLRETESAYCKVSGLEYE